MELSHVDENGAKMVDVGEKSATKRTAVARGEIKTKPETIILLTNKETPKGDVLNTARVAGIMAAKNTSSLIPMCHNVPLDNVKIEFEIGRDKVVVRRRNVQNRSRDGSACRGERRKPYDIRYAESRR